MVQPILFPAVIYVLMLIAPGYLLLRCAQFHHTWAFCCSPILSTFLVALLGEIYAALGVDATPVTIFVPILVVLAALSLSSRSMGMKLLVKSDDHHHSAELHDNTRQGISDPLLTPMAWWMPLLFVLIGVFICNNLFVSELSSLDAVMQNYDVQHHLNVTRAFVDAKRVSSLGVTFYETPRDMAIMPFGKPSFYPAIWYGQCALLVQATGISVPAALNTSLAVTLGIAYPLGMCAFVTSLFRKNNSAIAFCALTCVGFAMFPWCLLIFGPLYPNLVGFALTPASMGLCMHAFLSGGGPRRKLLSWLIVFAALVAQALLQPNTLFSMFLILIPFVVQLIWRSRRANGSSVLKSLFSVSLFLAICLAFWTACFKLPQFAVVIKEYWGDFAYPWQEVINILTQTYTLFFFAEITAQVLMGILVVVGFVRVAYDKHARWLAASYAILCIICFINATSTNAALKRFVSGFWYTDAMRVAAMTIIVASVLASYGMDWVYVQVCYVLDLYNARLSRKTHRTLVITVMVACFLLLNFMPGFNWPGAHAESTKHIVAYRMEGHEYDSMSVKTTFGDYRQKLRNSYDYNGPVDVHERVFLDEVKTIVGSDLVINNPYDGSALAYGVSGIRVYYRKAHGYGYDDETAQSLAIRTNLVNISTNEAVRAAVDDTGSRYVLILDATYSKGSFLRIRSNVGDGAYLGISQITPDTPGFTEVLASGACHLFSIDKT